MSTEYNPDNNGTISLTASRANLNLIIPTYNAKNLLRECLSNLKRTLKDTTQVLIVDDCSTDDTPHMVTKDFPEFQLTQTPKNLGFSGACNHGLTQVSTPYVGFLNNDAFPQENWAETLAKELEHDNQVAIVCSKIYQRDTPIIDSAGGIIEYPLGEAPPRGYLEPERGQYSQPTYVAYASGTAMVARTRLLQELGGFDSDYWSYHEETDLCWRLRLAGYKIRYVPQPVVHHIGSYTMGRNPAKKTFWSARNRCITNLKNLEAADLRTWLLYELIYSTFIPIGGLIFPAYREHALAYIQGLLSFTQTLPATLRKRGEIQTRRKVHDAEILKFHRAMTMPSLLKRNLRLAQTSDGHLFAPETDEPSSIQQQRNIQ